MKRHLTFFVLCVVSLQTAATLAARDFYVNPEAGNDESTGSRDSPLATAQRAVDLAESGDTIHLQPDGALYHQEIVLCGKRSITIDGHGVTLTGADPLPADGWEQIEGDLHRRKLNRPWNDRHLLIVGGKANRMGRSPSAKPDFPGPADLKPGEFAWTDIDESTGWLYVRGSLQDLQWGTRIAGIRTIGENCDITIRNLNCRHALNDGFNIHGDCRGVRCSKITGYENYDEGFSAHDTCQCWITDGRFWGNDNAVADVNAADTYYKNCEFRESMSYEVLLHGGHHSLEDCRIIASSVTAISIHPGGFGAKRPDGTRAEVPVDCLFRNLEVTSRDGRPRRVSLYDATVTIENSTFTNTEFRISGAKVKSTNSTHDGQPLAFPAITR